MGADGEGTISSTAFWWDANETARAFNTAFHDKAVAKGYARVEPSQFDAATHSIVRIYAAAMRHAGVSGDPAHLSEERVAIRNALAGGIAVETVEGVIKFDEAGDAMKHVIALEVRDGAWHPILMD